MGKLILNDISNWSSFRILRKLVTLISQHAVLQAQLETARRQGGKGRESSQEIPEEVIGEDRTLRIIGLKSIPELILKKCFTK